MRLFQHGFEVVEVVLVVSAGTGVLDRFPGDDEAQEVQPPMLEPGEVFVGFIQREGPADEAEVARFAPGSRAGG